MQVNVEERRLFYRLYSALLGYVNLKLDVLPERFMEPNKYLSLPLKARIMVRDALHRHEEWIDLFVADNPARLSAAELEIVASWKQALVGRFYILRYLSTRHE